VERAAVTVVTNVVTMKETVILTVIVKTAIIVVKITVTDLDSTKKMTAALKKLSVLGEMTAVIIITHVVKAKETVMTTPIAKTAFVVVLTTARDLVLTVLMTAVLRKTTLRFCQLGSGWLNK